jgi:hypothetical protein
LKASTYSLLVAAVALVRTLVLVVLVAVRITPNALQHLRRLN